MKLPVVGTLLESACARMPWYTDLAVVFDVLGGREREFDWLVTDLDCNDFPPELRSRTDRYFFAGEALSRLVHSQPQPVQFVWAVLTGFEHGTELDLSALQVHPMAQDNPDFWSGEPRIQYPGARVELVCWDSTATLLLTADVDLTARFRAGFPEAVDLQGHNRRRDAAGRGGRR